MELEARGLARAGCIPGALLCSPLVRARQTAEILLGAFGPGVSMAVSDNLAPGGDRAALYREIARRSKEGGSLMLVGHQPSLGEIAGDLAWGSPGCYVRLETGGVCAVDLEPFQGTLRGEMVLLVTPSVLRALAPQG